MRTRDAAKTPVGDLPLVSRKKTYVAYALATGLVLAFGAVRLPVESNLTREHRAASFGDVQLNLSLRSKIGQMGFLAALSGFRTLVADLVWIEAHTAWQKVEYGPMNLMLNTVVTLAPHNVNFWDFSSWHMAYNASVAAMNDRAEPKIAVRTRRQHEYFMIGVDFLERGIANNPGAFVLHQSLGTIYRDKLHEPLKAFEEYDKAAKFPNAPSYEKRFAAYELSKVPGREREAWERLRKLYDMGDAERLPTLEKDLERMEQALDLPEDQRIYKTHAENPLDDLKQKLGLPK